MPKKKAAKATPEAEITNETTSETQPQAAATTDLPAETPLEPAAVQDKTPRKPRKQKSNAISRTATIADVAAGYLADMGKQGKSNGTITSYGMELKTAMAELGAETLVGKLTPESVRAYFESRRVTKLRSGGNKARLGVAKTRRVLRLALVWAAERGFIAKAPLPALEAK